MRCPKRTLPTSNFELWEPRRPPPLLPLHGSAVPGGVQQANSATALASGFTPFARKTDLLRPTDLPPPAPLPGCYLYYLLRRDVVSRPNLDVVLISIRKYV
jgi:hypothetical protein